MTVAVPQTPLWRVQVGINFRIRSRRLMEATKIKRQMDYERADKIEAAERQGKGEQVTVADVAASHEAERRANQGNENRRPAGRQRAGKAAKRKAMMTGVDAPSLVPGGEWEWLSQVIPVLLKLARDGTSAKMLTITAGPKLNRAEAREIGGWFGTLADDSAGSAIGAVTSVNASKAALEECAGEANQYLARSNGR
jgi:hypothetical protein